MYEHLKVFQRSFDRLRSYVEAEKFIGFDPYDALNASIDFSRLGKWAPVFAIQIQKRLPLNLRDLMGIRKARNPKGIGLLLHAYAIQYRMTQCEESRPLLDVLFKELLVCTSSGFSGYGWGYNFDWASPGKYLPAYTPSVVVSAFVGKGVRAYYECTHSAEALDVLKGICQFIEAELPRVEDERGICFSYTPLKRDCCYNASLLGAEMLSGVYALTGEERYRVMAVRAVDFVIAKQKADGRWNYSLDLKTGRERSQVDFHQGFILDSLQTCIQDTGMVEARYRRALQKGVAFYRQSQFTEEGRSLWRLPRSWPTDIHHQAQGIITFCRLGHLDASYLEFAQTIADWTLRYMQDEQHGFFYYRVGRLIKNKIPYMRWGQAWMMLALSQLLASIIEPEVMLRR